MTVPPEKDGSVPPEEDGSDSAEEEDSDPPEEDGSVPPEEDGPDSAEEEDSDPPEEDGSLVLVQPAFLGHGGQVGGHGAHHRRADEEGDQQAEHGTVEQAEVQHPEDPLQQLPRGGEARAARDQ